MEELQLQSQHHTQLIDITDRVAQIARRVDCSALLVYVPHTTAGVLINEHADPDVAHDILLSLASMVAERDDFRHAEGNSVAHVKATLVGTSQLVPIRDGRLALGRWQGVFFAEFDGPRSRSVIVVPISHAGDQRQ